MSKGKRINASVHPEERRTWRRRPHARGVPAASRPGGQHAGLEGGGQHAGAERGRRGGDHAAVRPRPRRPGPAGGPAPLQRLQLAAGRLGRLPLPRLRAAGGRHRGGHQHGLRPPAPAGLAGLHRRRLPPHGHLHAGEAAALRRGAEDHQGPLVLGALCLDLRGAGGHLGPVAAAGLGDVVPRGPRLRVARRGELRGRLAAAEAGGGGGSHHPQAAGLHQAGRLLPGGRLLLPPRGRPGSFAAGIRGGVFTLVFARLNLRLRNCLFRSLVAQEMSFFDENRTGDVISRLTSDTTIVSDLVSQNINIFLRNVVKATGVIIFMFSLSWKLSLVTFMGFPIIMLVSDVYGKYYKKLSKEVQSALAKANNTAEETISAMKTVRSFANEEAEADVYWQKLQQVYKLNRREALAYTYYVWSSGLTLLVVQVSILYYGGHLVISGQMTSGNLISFIIYEFVLGDCMESVGSVYSGLMQGVGAAEKVFEFIDRQPTMVNDGSLAPDHVDGQVEFRNVTFSYRTRSSTQVLENVSFTLRPGQVTALVGPSGSGKSSCVNILENFYPLQDGQVLLDGRPIATYDHKYLHSVISLVSQEPVLFARSIADNISYGLTSASFESVVQAAQKANAHAFITELQDGYHTEAGEKGAQLSGGQKQRVAIARALIRNPPILVLDEATSALDAESEHAIQQAIYGDLQNHTVLVIAHRLSTVEKAHNIVVLDKGRVVQQGSHKELMEEGGLYCKLVQRQILGLEAGGADGHRPAAHGDSRRAPGGLEEEFRIDRSLAAVAPDDYNATAPK
ncbi:ATP-binding cassette sub-family B member 9 isoform X2 [Apteryx rowi]|uniref:ATP-binding cassette sub-family B member 9 isoform X2 n=1 Tax=Apteryx rowi TaxID=308060 RepID=UPI000E1C8261|nr:ATP-binding cassette sub-family B member 9 isoform X2 [Apteryx rowi]